MQQKTYYQLITKIKLDSLKQGNSLDFWSIDRAVTKFILDKENNITNWSKYVNEQSGLSMHDTILDSTNELDTKLILQLSDSMESLLTEAKKFQLENKMNAEVDKATLLNRTINILTGEANTPEQVRRGIDLLSANNHWLKIAEEIAPENTEPLENKEFWNRFNF